MSSIAGGDRRFGSGLRMPSQLPRGVASDASGLIAVDPGVGLSWFNEGSRPRSFEARYPMLTRTTLGLAGRLDVQRLAAVPHDAVYLDRDSPCTSAPSTR